MSPRRLPLGRTRDREKAIKSEENVDRAPGRDTPSCPQPLSSIRAELTVGDSYAPTPRGLACRQKEKSTQTPATSPQGDRPQRPTSEWTLRRQGTRGTRRTIPTTGSPQRLHGACAADHHMPAVLPAALLPTGPSSMAAARCPPVAALLPARPPATRPVGSPANPSARSLAARPPARPPPLTARRRLR